MKTLIVGGNSISIGCHVKNPSNMACNILLQLLRKEDPDWELMYPPHGLSHPNFGLMQNNIKERCIRLRPNVCAIIGWCENDYSQETRILAANLGQTATLVTFNDTFTKGRAYAIGDPEEDEPEIIIPREGANGGTTGYHVIRGAFGTRVRSWSAGTPLWGWDNNWSDNYMKIVELGLIDLVTSSPDTLFLIGGNVFTDAFYSVDNKIKSLVEKLKDSGFDNIEYCEYIDDNGNKIFGPAPGSNTGPSGYLGANSPAGSSTLTLLPGYSSRFTPGDIITVLPNSGDIQTTNSVVMKVTAVSGNTLTVDTTDGRNKWGSSDRNCSASDRVALYCPLGLSPRAPQPLYHDADANGWLPNAFQYDRHPNDRGHVFLGKAFYRGYVNAIDRMTYRNNRDRTKRYIQFIRNRVLWN